MRIIFRNKRLRISITTLLKAVPSILNLLMILALVYVIFGIVAVSFYKSMYSYCSNSNLIGITASLIKTKTDCFNYGGEWLTFAHNFDNI